MTVKIAHQKKPTELTTFGALGVDSAFRLVKGEDYYVYVKVYSNEEKEQSDSVLEIDVDDGTMYFRKSFAPETEVILITLTISVEG